MTKLIAGFSDLAFDENAKLTFSAYGSIRHALVFDDNYLVIYDPAGEREVGWYDLAKTPESDLCTFTSVIAAENDFFLGCSDGSILRCCWTKTSAYNFIRSTDDGIAGFAFEIARSRPILLAANKKWLVHFSSGKQSSVAFLPRNIDRTDGLVEDIHGAFKAHAFCSTKNVLWVATETKNHYYLYKIKAEQRTQRIYRIKRLEYDNLLAVSSQGFIAVANMGLCTIFQPGKDDRFCQLFEREIGENNQGGHGCFATYGGTEFFVFCREKYSEIAVVSYTGGTWEETQWFERFDENHLGDTSFDLGASYDKSRLVHCAVDGQGRLVVQVAGEDGDTQGLLISSPPKLKKN